MNVLIVCAEGMTSSNLTQKTRNLIKEKGLEDIKVGSCGISQVKKYAPMADMILLTPQVSYMQKEICKLDYTICKVLPTDVYSNNGAISILNTILSKDKKVIKINPILLFLQKGMALISSNTILSILHTSLLEIFPIIFIGSIFTLIQEFPIEAWTNFIQNTPINSFLSIGYDMSYGLFSLYVVLFLAKNYAIKKDLSPSGIMISSTACFFMMTEAFHNGYIDLTYFGVKGLFFAIFVAFSTGWLYTKWIHLANKFFYIQGLRKDIQDSLLTIPPVLLCCVFSILVTLVIHYLCNSSLPEYIYTLLIKYADPIIGKNTFTVVVVSAIASLLWFCGLHGGKITGSVTESFYYSYSLINLQAYQAHQALPYITTSRTTLMYTFGGVGSTLSLAFLMAFFAKSEKLKELGKLSFPMGIFFINEPIVFGLPYVFNLQLLIPFVGIPTISGIVTVLLMLKGILPKCNGINIPWTTPPIISGFIEGGWKLALWQAFLLVIQTFLWYPFFHYLDKKAQEKESA